MRRHCASKNEDSVDHIQLQTYQFRFDYEWINCDCCGQSMFGYYDHEDWPYGAAEFHRGFQQIADGMIGLGMIEASNPHMKLRGDIGERQSSIHVCPMCGWWVAVDSAVLPAIGRQFWLINLVSTAALVDFDLTDITTPIEEVRQHLWRRFETRHTLHPRLFEQTVTSVFRDIGYDAEATAYSNDGGIDVVLRGTDGKLIGVQVKRRHRSIEVEQIRSFLGALVLGGFTRGIFVSTSKFQRGAIQAAETISRLHMPIELVDPERFLDMLGIAQLSCDVEPENCGFFDTPQPPVFLHSGYHLSSI